jgi:hypothetical protein
MYLSRFPVYILYAVLISFIHSTVLMSLILPDFIVLVICHEKYKP